MVINGIFPALTTPFATDGTVSLSGVRQNIARYNQTAVAGYVVLGSTGESEMLSREEAESILVDAREAGRAAKLLNSRKRAETTAENIAKTQRAGALG